MEFVFLLLGLLCGFLGCFAWYSKKEARQALKAVALSEQTIELQAQQLKRYQNCLLDPSSPVFKNITAPVSLADLLQEISTASPTMPAQGFVLPSAPQTY